MEKLQEKLEIIQQALAKLESERLDAADEPSSSQAALDLAQLYKVAVLFFLDKLETESDFFALGVRS